MLACSGVSGCQVEKEHALLFRLLPRMPLLAPREAARTIHGQNAPNCSMEYYTEAPEAFVISQLRFGAGFDGSGHI